jgi:pyruvate formate lyase activating enzyme
MTSLSGSQGAGSCLPSNAGAGLLPVVDAPAVAVLCDLIPVAGVVPLTTLDFPGRLALVVFTQGCVWHCPYCHNAGMRPRTAPTAWCWRQVCELLDRRRGLLEAVVFSGGEPTLHPGLETALRTVRAKGFLTGLHTAGIFPEHLQRLLPLLDWVGLDIKAPFDERYPRLTGDSRSAIKASASLDLLLAAANPFQLRTTVTDDLPGERIFEEVRAGLRHRGAPEPVRQSARSVSLNPASQTLL